MKKSLIPLLTALALAALPAAASAEQHGHGHEHGATSLQLNHGKKWPTDEPLRRNMQALSAEFAARHAAIERNKMTAGEYAALGQVIEARVATIVRECKLPPDADAMLHLVIADLVASADVMQGKATGRPSEAARTAVAALDGYGRHFQHPGWKPVH